MRSWPVIEDPATLEWLGLDHDGWVAALRRRIGGIPPRVLDEAKAAHALAYPWARPEGSYVLRDGVVTAVEDRAVVEEFAEGRYPLVAFGANGAPSRLQERFADFPEARDRNALVLTGWLHEVDVAAQATPTAFGYVPAVLVACPGTAVRASVLWLTSNQLAKITLMELGYHFGRLDRAHFEMDEAGITVEDLFAYVSRGGALNVDGEPVALAAVPARNRTLRAVTQEEALDLLARLAIGPDARVQDVMRLSFEAPSELLGRLAEKTWPDAVRMPDDHWTPYPT